MLRLGLNLGRGVLCPLGFLFLFTNRSRAVGRGVNSRQSLEPSLPLVSFPRGCGQLSTAFRALLNLYELSKVAGGRPLFTFSLSRRFWPVPIYRQTRRDPQALPIPLSQVLIYSDFSALVLATN